MNEFALTSLSLVFMTYVKELRKLPVQWRKIIKKLENTKLKLANWSTQFNHVCLKENLLPNYTRIFY